MVLPKSKTAIYTLTLPSTGKSYKYRPWDGLQEKSLQIALMDDDKLTIKNTFQSVINECLFEELNVENLPDVDQDWIITQLRIKSVSEIVELVTTCPNKSCGKEIDLYANLLDTEVIDNLKEKRDLPIKIDDNIFFKLKLPTSEAITKLQLGLIGTEELLATMLDSIYTETEVHNPIDYTTEELVEYIESFNKKTLTEVYEYVHNLPEVVNTSNVKCKHCGTEHKVILKGVDFFLS